MMAGEHTPMPSAKRLEKRARHRARLAKQLARLTPTDNRAITLAFELHGPAPDKDELVATLHGLGIGRQAGDLARVYRWRYEDVGLLGMRASRPQMAGAGHPITEGPAFRSQWERRLAAALDRLQVRWSFEPEWFNYSDVSGRRRRYTPDFRLDDLSRTFVEVKGWAGPDAADSVKMRRVVAGYPTLTLLLWDASLVETIEDAPDSGFIIRLVETSRV